MDKLGTRDKETVISVLTQGREFANLLQGELNPTATSREACDFLLERILSCYDNALTQLNCMGLHGNRKHPSDTCVFSMLESPVSFEGNNRGEASGPDSKDQVHVSKKRKTVAKRGEQVRVCRETGVEGDGYNWRKYGQKAIQGANHPRAYFRCTHRHTRGCLAKKQVQRTDECSSISDVIYRGKHTCMQEMIKHNHNNEVMKKVEEESTKPEFQVESETSEKHTNEEDFLDFSFPSTPVAFENMGTGLYSEPQSLIERSYSPPFLSPATSESYFSLSASQMNGFGICQSLPSSESDFTEIISNPTTNPDFPTGDLDFLTDLVDFNSPFLDAFDCF